MIDTERNILAVVREFCASDAIDAETPLFGDGHLDSFRVVELTSALSTRLGLPFAAGTLLPEDFETPRVLARRIVDVTS